jgi:tetratricopeptide (TPR) repeat protein
MLRLVSLIGALQLLITNSFAQNSVGDYQKQVAANPRNSLAHYRLGEIFFQQRRYILAANAFRASIRGDRQPKWTEVKSHIKLGNIFDVTGQRERAINEYKSALDTKDNTDGALEEANRYLKSPYRSPSTVAK